MLTTKKIAGQVLTQFTEFLLTKQKKLFPEWAMNELGKPFRKQSDQKIKRIAKNQC